MPYRVDMINSTFTLVQMVLEKLGPKVKELVTERAKIQSGSLAPEPVL